MDFLYFLIIGALAGFLAGQIVRGAGFGLIWNLIIGIVGAMVGGSLFRMIGLASVGLIGSLITATVGAVVLLWVINAFMRRKAS